MSMESAPASAVSPRADLLSALVWVAIGLAIVVGSWRMERLEKLHINKYEVPGLVPGLLGAAIVVLGVLLAVRALRQGALRPQGAPLAQQGGARVYMATVLGAMLAYALVLVGHGIPFWLATFLFVGGFIFWFDRDRQAALGRGPLKQALLALAYGGATAAIVSLAFQEVFYVRLP